MRSRFQRICVCSLPVSYFRFCIGAVFYFPRESPNNSETKSMYIVFIVRILFYLPKNIMTIMIILNYLFCRDCRKLVIYTIIRTFDWRLLASHLYTTDFLTFNFTFRVIAYKSGALHMAINYHRSAAVYLNIRNDI